jgi:STE24 endopeptidase
VRPASLANLALGLAVSAVLGLTRLGSRLITTLGGAVRGRAVRFRWLWQVVSGAVVLTVISELVLLPLGVYLEVVDHRYGLSTESWGLWARDVVVSTAITAGLTALGLVGLVALARRAPRTWWAWAAAAAAVLVVAGSFLWPLVIEPAFNRFTPMPPGQLRSDLFALARENGTPVDEVLVADASRRTTSLNAYVSGFGASRRIVVYDTVLRQLPGRQIESIVAHELGHVSANDVLTKTLVGAIGAAAGVAALGWLLGWRPLLRRAGADGPGDPRVVPLALLLVAVGTLLATPVQNLQSRQLEARADLHALDLTRDPQTFIAMQKRLAQSGLNEPQPPRVLHLLFGDHPTEAERVAMAQTWERLYRR